MGIDMKLGNIVLGLAALALLAGCSSFSAKGKVDYKTGTVQLPPLEVPPELTTPESDQRYSIPGSEGGMVASYSEYSKQKPEQPCVAPAAVVAPPSAPAVAAVPAPKLQENNGAKHIVLGEAFDRSWRRVGLALDRARIAVTDKDRSKGIYYIIVPGKKADKDKVKVYDHLLLVREIPAGCDVSVTDPSGKSGVVSSRVIESVYQNLNSENLPGGNPPPAELPAGNPPM